MIKVALLGDVRGALQEAHCQDQKQLHSQILCFENCDKSKKQGSDSCGTRCEGEDHTVCRQALLELYKTHITECRALDDFVSDFNKLSCPKFEKKCCLLGHSTWNCGGLCSSQIANLDVDASLGSWIADQTAKFRSAFDT